MALSYLHGLDSPTTVTVCEELLVEADLLMVGFW